MSNSVNPILLRPVLEIALAINSVLLRMEQFTAWLQSGQHAAGLFPLVAVILSGKQLRNVHQTWVCDSSVLIISCLSLLFCDSARPGRLQLFYKQKVGGVEGPLYLGLLPGWFHWFSYPVTTSLGLVYVFVIPGQQVLPS